MQDRRLLLHALLKTLVFSAVLLLLLVFVNSLFTDSKIRLNTAGAVQKVQLDVSDLQPGQIKKTRWKGKEVAVLRRLSLEKIPPLHTIFKEDLHKSLDAWSRSQKPEYFVYFNAGDSGNCPLFYSQGKFKDICTANKFDQNGRDIRGDQGGFTIEISPHHFIDNVVVFGSWGK
jgi:hypothetical protein